ncbi:hypothetical protein C6N75_15145 [Streptomyces solincola]|uniref:Uncharacterized protein n=1 Tax=Streptomyces solincola TaxID=2100817 RepID=A0A2S9PVD8_9ACTN|nr:MULTISPECIES: hypothetical protein [Streptomyces]PRH78396.1 hypothetical protein C6N75_15145 [Streptomyces solincola]
MTLTLMWEARAVDGRGAELLSWARAQPLPSDPAPLRRETFTATGDRVLVLTWWDAADGAEVPELPAPPADLLARPVHRWRFTSVEVAGEAWRRCG